VDEATNVVGIIVTASGVVLVLFAVCSLAVCLERRYSCVQGHSLPLRFWTWGKAKGQGAPRAPASTVTLSPVSTLSV
jgi:hypothetical protein